MTGFARASAETSQGELNCEIRAVNHRYLDAQLRLPDELRGDEADLRGQIATQVGRGKLECSLYLKRSGGAGQKTIVNPDVLKSLSDLLTKAATELPNTAPISALEALRWPGVLEEPAIETDQLLEAASRLLDETLLAFNAMRAREGNRLATLLVERLNTIASITATVTERRTEVVAAMRQRIEERIRSISSDVDPARLATEVAILAQKLDVDEELDRLASHLVEVREVLTRDEPIGRRLDFLMQELNREVNTLASKAADAGTTNASVDLKVLIEQMREQIQNIE